MTPPSPLSNSRFFWQGWLILLPVVVLTALGFYAVRQDKRLVEQEARQRAAELAGELSARLGRQIAGELAAFEVAGGLWAGPGVIGAWPGRSSLNIEEFERRKKLLEEWQANHPDLRPVDVFPVRSLLTETGRLSSPVDYPVPPPPPWLDELSSEQKSLWDRAWQTRFDSTDANLIKGAFERLFAANPAQPAKANAEFALLLLDMQTNAPVKRIERLLRFGQACGPELSEGGLPLRALALARALNEATDIGVTEALFDEITAVQNADAPSFLTPLLLENAERLASNQSPAIRQAVAGQRLRWEAQERLRTMARRVQEMLRLNLISTNLWLDWGAHRWFAVVDPKWTYLITSTNGQNITISNRLTSIRFFPKAAVQRAFERALIQPAVPTPAYFSLRLALDNELILDTAAGAPSRPTMLAGSEALLSLPGIMDLGKNAEGSQSFGGNSETLPSHPRLAVEIGLADAHALYARARQRAWIFGAMLLAAASVVLVGLIMMQRAFQRQQRLNEMKSNFVSSVSHELRAPIASVRLMAEGLESGRIKDEAKKQGYFKFIVQECRRLSSLIENVLDFSRIEQGRKQYEFEPTDWVAMVRHAIQIMEPSATERGVTLQLQLDNAQRPSFNSQPMMDGRALQQALLNLIDNALKHSPDGSTVTIGLDIQTAANPNSRSTKHGSCLLLWVEDQGEGIAAGEHERIFERFYRLGSELRRETQGVGIGLSIVKHIAEAHGGTVRVRSAPGEGSRFTMELPAREQSQRTPAFSN
jgi:signal transduction histidine kinase